MKKLALIIILLILCGQNVEARLFTERIDRVVSDLEEAIRQNNMMKISSSFEELTYIYNDIDDLEQVDSICFQLIDLNKMLYGEESAEYGRALCRYAGAKLRKRDYETATKYLKLGEPIIMAAVGDHHPHYATVLETKGTMYFVNNKFNESAVCYRKAESIYKDAISHSKDVLSKYRPDYVGVIAMKNYAQFLSGDNMSGLDEDFVEIERLYVKDNDEIGLSDALMLKAQIEIKSRDLFAARYDTERVLNILNKNLGDMKIFKMINTAMQLANILQLLGDFNTADILIDQEIDDILTNPKLDQYGALGSLYMMKSNGYIQNDINSEDAEYYSEKAMSLLDKESYLSSNYLASKYYHSVALGRNGKLEESAAEALECLNSIKNNVYSISDLEKKYIYWFQYTNALMQISTEKAFEVLGEIEKSFNAECSRHLKKRQLHH